jgi:hypothetical protein
MSDPTNKFSLLLDYQRLQERAESMRANGIDVLVRLTAGRIDVSSPLCQNIDGMATGVMFTSIEEADAFLLGLSAAAGAQGKDATQPLNTEGPQSPDEVRHEVFVFEAGNPLAEAVNALLKAVIDPAASKADRLVAAGEVMHVVANL